MTAVPLCAKVLGASPERCNRDRGHDGDCAQVARRLLACVAVWPEAWTMGYDPSCCRFPKSCSADVYNPEHVTSAQVEPDPARPTEATRQTDMAEAARLAHAQANRLLLRAATRGVHTAEELQARHDAGDHDLCPLGWCMVNVRALTVQQPWAWSMFHGSPVKDVENRTQAWKYRGPLLIHAGNRLSERGFHHPAYEAGMTRETSRTRRRLDIRGAIIGVVNLTDVHHATPVCCDSPWAETSYAEHGGKTRRALTHLAIKDPVSIDPIECRGRLGLWSPPDDVLEELRWTVIISTSPELVARINALVPVAPQIDSPRTFCNPTP